MSPKKPRTRAPLTRDRVLFAAVQLADRAGLSALTMRRLGADLGVEAMSLYKHVANKDEILDGIVELVVTEIDIPSIEADWKVAMRQRAVSAREVLNRHSWAVGLLEERGSTGPSSMRYTDAIIGNLRSAGFSIQNAAHAFWLLDSYVYGQVVQEQSFTAGAAGETEATEPPDVTADDYPHLVEMQQDAQTSEYTFDKEFEFGLDLILDALEAIAN